jgi:triosephosphate isomerase
MAPAGAPRRKIVGGNWKSNPANLKTVKELCDVFASCSFDATKCEAVVFPPSLHCATAYEGLKNTAWEVGFQNISKTGAGAFTGECTADMVAEMGYGWALVGHSERRKLYGETDEETALKVEKSLAAGLRVIIAIGESLEEREKGITDQVNARQLSAIIPKVRDWDKIVIAYEPIWAIGTGKVATPQMAQDTHAAIRKFLAEKCGADVAAKVRIQYGGSSTPDNCGELIAQPDIDGFLVGGASLKPTFTKMVTTCAA